jgi:hypothetical protein
VEEDGSDLEEEEEVSDLEEEEVSDLEEEEEEEEKEGSEPLPPSSSQVGVAWRSQREGGTTVS